MSISEREAWNRRYREGSHHSTKADPFLVQAFEQYINPEFPKGGAALDVAGGIGRHAIWLARRNWKVTLAEISEVGLEQARKRARNLSGDINFVAADLQELSSSPAPALFRRSVYDLILVFFYLERPLFPLLLRALKPGGFLLYKTYTLEQKRLSSGPTNPLRLLKQNELLDAFSSLRVLAYRETAYDPFAAEFLGRKQR
jgi:ubiquinone/menaquinone biosynthesis C-methylase UbiE